MSDCVEFVVVKAVRLPQKEWATILQKDENAFISCAWNYTLHSTKERTSSYVNLRYVGWETASMLVAEGAMLAPPPKESRIILGKLRMAFEPHPLRPGEYHVPSASEQSRLATEKEDIFAYSAEGFPNSVYSLWGDTKRELVRIPRNLLRMEGIKFRGESEPHRDGAGRLLVGVFYGQENARAPDPWARVWDNSWWTGEVIKHSTRTGFSFEGVKLGNAPSIRPPRSVAPRGSLPGAREMIEAVKRLHETVLYYNSDTGEVQDTPPEAVPPGDKPGGRADFSMR